MESTEKTRDYSSFSSAAKSRFRPMAKSLGYEQTTATVYMKDRGDWYETFNLQASSYGNPFFYINYGVCVPDQWPSEKQELKNAGWILGSRLSYDGSGAFPCKTKAEIEESAEYALGEYNREAVPWFKNLNLKEICDLYFETTNLDKDRLGRHEWGLQLSAANYGFLLLKAGKKTDAMAWLREAERLMALPVFITREGNVVHEREKYSRIEKPERDELERLEIVQRTIKELSFA
ncbi:DUF4304 domain-containing protein [Marinobacter salexigens]|uniref:DUF4304 domain-containing protein n=1 Tax=Marinobacter salexigens TaxID=1925763 RepID=A0ABS6AAH3_9GAMM|nr:DUF4304 domain-containing protein [Marinobacter salexigens]MBU2873844.1 DUF4304 domain-containing protein [Marinobacter salexigens]